METELQRKVLNYYKEQSDDITSSTANSVFKKGDIITVNPTSMYGEKVIITKVENGLLTIRGPRWYEKLMWAIKDFIKCFIKGVSQEYKA